MAVTRETSWFGERPRRDAPESFPYKIIFASMFNDITDNTRKRMEWKCLDSKREVDSHAARFRPGVLVRLWSGVGIDLKKWRVKHLLLNLLMVGWANSLLCRQENLSPADMLEKGKPEMHFEKRA